MSLDIEITVAYPPRTCRPNYRPASKAGRMAQSRETKSYRQSCAWLARCAVEDAKRDLPGWTSGTICAHVRRARREFPDAANVGALLKAAIDGLVDAGIYADDRNVNVMLASADMDLELVAKCIGGLGDYIRLVCSGQKEQP